jgi:hypothetical protein
LYNGHAAVVNTSSLAILSFTIPSQVPYALAAVYLDASLRPYFIPTPRESDGDASDEDKPMAENDEATFYSGEDTDGNDASSAVSVEDAVVSVQEDVYTYQALTFNLDRKKSIRSFRKRLAKVRKLVAE